MVIILALAACTGLAKVEPSVYPEPKRNAITFWGHACSYIDVDGMGIVTDPVFDKMLWQRRRFIGSPSDEALHGVRVVLISHAHDDHLSPSSLRRMPKDATILCPDPAAEFLAGKGIAARVMKVGDEFRADSVRIIAVPAFHPGTRRGIHRAVDGRALGWVIVAPHATVFYSGDTDYSSTFTNVAERFAPDIAILNVNGHLKPPDAARAAHDTRTRVVIPTHWGAYTYLVVGGNRRPRGEDELVRLLDGRLHILNVGESLPLARDGNK